MKKSVKIGLLILMLFVILALAMIYVLANIEIKSSLSNQGTNNGQTTDEDILSSLKENNIINSNDIYVAYDRDIGLFGPEGDKRYIYKKDNGTYYYVEISSLSYTDDGEYSGYNYEANEVFYKIDIQDCEYNQAAESMDERILEVHGEISYYIVSGSKNNLEVSQIF